MRAGEPLDAGGAPLSCCAPTARWPHGAGRASASTSCPAGGHPPGRAHPLAGHPGRGRAAAEALVHWLGLHAEWVGDAPGLVLGRIVCQLVNEAAFAIGEGVGSAADVDAGLTLGLNYPRGAVAWGEEIGLATCSP